MEVEIKKLLFNPTVGRIVAIFIGIAIIWTIIKILRKKFFSKIKSNDNRYRVQKLETFAGYILTIVLIAGCFQR